MIAEIDPERLEAFNCALRLAVEERTGVDPGPLNGLDLASYMLIDADRALEIMQICFKPGE